MYTNQKLRNFLKYISLSQTFISFRNFTHTTAQNKGLFHIHTFIYSFCITFLYAFSFLFNFAPAIKYVE